MRGDLLRLASEQARELALVRGEDARRRPLARLELEERVGVDDRRQLDLREQPADERLRLISAAEARPDRERLRLRRRLEDILERPLHRLQHERLEHRERLGRCGDRHVADVGAEGGAGRERRCPGHAARAADDEDVAGRVLVVARRAARHLGQDLPRDEPMLGLRRLEADVGHRHLAGVEASRRDREADLGAVHRHRHVGVHRRARDLPGGRVHARRDVDGQHRNTGRVDLLDELRRLLPRSAFQPGAEESVDHDVRALVDQLAPLRLQDLGTRCARRRRSRRHPRGERSAGRRASGA